MTRILLDGRGISPEDIWAVAHGAQTALCPEAEQRMQRNHQEWLDLGAPDVLAGKEAWLLGSTHAQRAPNPERLRAFVESHCAGVGKSLPTVWVRALMAARANVLAGAHSGCRPDSVHMLIEMLNHRIHPVVPRLGSVGAAGDLAPLAHVARVVFRLGGEAEVNGEILSAIEAMEPLSEFSPTSKEALSFINGATLSSALAAIACVRAEKLLASSETILAMTMEAVLAQSGCIDESALQARGQAGGIGVARRLSAMLKDSEMVRPDRQADAFSIRCAPSVLGAAHDSLSHVKQVVTQELNGACDNPLILNGKLIETGNFHGAPIGLVMDQLKTTMTQVATLSERRTFRMTHGDLSGRLPSFLVDDTGTNSGFMLAQYTAASLASECKGLAMPASVDSIPTGQHHEDHVSMAPIAARSCLRILDALAEILGIEALCAAQALDFRIEGAHFDADGKKQIGPSLRPSKSVQVSHETVRKVSAQWTIDRVLHLEIQACAKLLRNGDLLPQTSPW